MQIKAGAVRVRVVEVAHATSPWPGDGSKRGEKKGSGEVLRKAWQLQRVCRRVS
jgi:hypothetical protein